MTDSLASRLAVSVLGIPAIVLLVYLGRVYFAIFVTAASLLALREFYILSRSKAISPQLAVGSLACLLVSWFYYQGLESTIFSLSWQQVIVILVIISVILELFRNKEKGTENIAVTLAGILYIPFLLGGLIGLRQVDPVDYGFGMRLTMILFVSVWVCDSAAYAFGKKWGRRKIMERVSPQKTVVGSLAGFVSAVAFYFLVWALGLLESTRSGVVLSILDVLILGIIVGVFGQLGDFVESFLKRNVGVKDSGSFLPGHGGVLDRFDSLILASPLAFLYLTVTHY